MAATPETPALSGAVEVQVRRLEGHEDLPLPQYQSLHAAGMDLYAAVPVDAPLTLAPLTRDAKAAMAVVPCGIAIAIPPGFEGQIRPRSGLASRHGISIPNAPGTIDADYRGPLMVALINLGPEPFTITRGMRIAQLVIAPVAQAKWVVVPQLPDTSRGQGGFGHTGT